MQTQLQSFTIGQKAISIFVQDSFEIQKEYKTALLIVTHDLNLAAKMDRVMSLEQGRLQAATTTVPPLAHDSIAPEQMTGEVPHHAENQA